MFCIIKCNTRTFYLSNMYKNCDRIDFCTYMNNLTLNVEILQVTNSWTSKQYLGLPIFKFVNAKIQKSSRNPSIIQFGKVSIRHSLKFRHTFTHLSHSNKPRRLCDSCLRVPMSSHVQTAQNFPSNYHCQELPPVCNVIMTMHDLHSNVLQNVFVRQ